MSSNKFIQMDEASEKGIGVYIHVPFCASKCAYCDFYSRVRQDQKEGYLETVLKEIHLYKDQKLKTGSLFFGGGTPSLLTSSDFQSTFSALEETMPILSGAEITLEANPETVTLESLTTLREIGFNRISFGIQSAVDRELKALGRRHTFSRAEEAVCSAREAGFENISVDLMLGIPFQTRESLDYTIERILFLRPEHISCYLLKIEEGTPFYHRHAEKDCASDDETADFYLHVCETLRNAGYQHYEISNFALPGFYSRHNLKYWHDEDYLGLGPAAHSCLNRKRFFNPPDLACYIDKNGNCSESEDDAPAQDAYERLMLGLRLNEGVDLDRIGQFDPGFDEKKKDELLRKTVPFAKAGLIETNGKKIRLTEKGMLVSNGILVELLY